MLENYNFDHCFDMQFTFYTFYFSSSSFAALFSPAKRRQMETQDSTPRRPPILGRHSPGRELDEVDKGVPLARAAGYCNTGVIPVLRKSGRKQGNGRQWSDMLSILRDVP